MPRINRLIALALLTACACVYAQETPPMDKGPENSNLDGELFYDLMVGELTLQQGDHSAAFALMLNAARKANSPRLYERAVSIAWRARSGDAALEAAQAWARAFPSSQEANRVQLQILLGLNRIAETLEPLKRELTSLSAQERAATIDVLPRYYARATDRKQAAQVVEKALTPDLGDLLTGAAAWATIGAMRLQAQDLDGALEAARRGVAFNPQAQEPVQLAIALVSPKMPDAEAVVRRYLAGKPEPAVRMAYANQLVSGQRFADAYAQMRGLTDENPSYPEAWLLRGSLELHDSKLDMAQTSLKTYLALAAHPAEGAAPNAPMTRGHVQAYLWLSQVAEQRQKLDEARAYLDQINSPGDALRIQRRYASILVREGKLDEARAAIHNVPEQQTTDALDKINAEVQLLRDNHYYAQAYQLLQDSAKRYPDDSDLVYDQAMMAEKLGKPDEMEQLLRRVMQAKPDYHHAYNALGYSLADRNIRLPEARQLITKALKFAPDDPFIVDSLAWVEFRSGNAQEALRLLKGAFEARPDAEIAAHLGEVLWSVGQRDQASAIWKEGIGLNPQNETLQGTMKRLRGADAP